MNRQKCYRVIRDEKRKSEEGEQMAYNKLQNLFVSFSAVFFRDLTRPRQLEAVPFLVALQ